MKSGDTTHMESKIKGSVSYTDKLEKEHPGYLRELFRYAQKTKGVLASFTDLADCMCRKSDAPSEDRPTLYLHPLQLQRWFKKNSGVEKSATPDPRLTDDHKKKRIEFAQEWLQYLKDHLPCAYLDEKWLY
jgi:hypothetical protein